MVATHCERCGARSAQDCADGGQCEHFAERLIATTGPYLGESQMTLARAREAFGELTTGLRVSSYLTFTTHDAIWVPVFDDFLVCRGYEARPRMEEED